jgi:methionine synthase II (cobalamin-independent)
VDEEVLRAKLREVLTATRAYTIVHCCAAGFPFGTITGAGADAVSFDLSLLRQREYDLLAEAAEAGVGLLLGAAKVDVQSNQAERAGVTPASIAETVRELWRMMGLPPAGCAEQVVITPACGLAGASPDQARDTLRLCREAAAILPEMMGELA